MDLHNIQYIFDNSLEKFGTCANLIKGLDSQAGVVVLSKCNCCERHKLNKPKKHLYWKKGENPYPFHNKQPIDIINNLSQCSCDCRHLTRWLCRGMDIDSLCKSCNVE